MWGDGLELEKLVSKARSGDDKAFIALVQLEKENLYRIAYLYVKTREDALDLVSETVYKAYVSIRKLRDPATFKAWITRILVNCSLDHLKKRGKVVFLNAVEIDSLPGEGEWQGRAENLDIYAAMDSLDEKCRTVIILKYFQDFTIAQIAGIMDCPQGTVKTYLHRALGNLRTKLKEDWSNARP